MKFYETCGRFFDDDTLEVCSHDGSPLKTMARRDDAAERLVGETIDGRFEVVSLLGRGGMGAVYRARQTSGVRRHASLGTLGAPPPLGSISRQTRSKLASPSRRATPSITRVSTLRPL